MVGQQGQYVNEGQTEARREFDEARIQIWKQTR
jgi:hypothetical protein